MKKIVLLLMLSIPALKADSLDFMTKEDELEECFIKGNGEALLYVSMVLLILKETGEFPFYLRRIQKL